VLETEITEALGAEKGEQTVGRQGYRSGYYGRTLISLRLRRFWSEHRHACFGWMHRGAARIVTGCFPVRWPRL